jgi:hypothetical protein
LELANGLALIFVMACILLMASCSEWAGVCMCVHVWRTLIEELRKPANTIS